MNPPTPVRHVEPYLRHIDLLLVMTVNPGFGGQPFISETLPKIQQAARWRRELRQDWRIEVDGGITQETARDCAAAGADTFVAGTSLFRAPRMGAALRRMRETVTRAAPAAPPASAP